MRRGVVCVEPEDPVVVAADLMVETHLRSLPVVQRKSGGPVLIGMVSQGDLLRGLRFELVRRDVGRDFSRRDDRLDTPERHVKRERLLLGWLLLRCCCARYTIVVSTLTPVLL